MKDQNMVLARLKGFSKNGSFAVLAVKTNPFSVTDKTVYAPAQPFAGAEVGSLVEIPVGYNLVTQKSRETGEPMCFSDGTQMLFLSYEE